MDYVLINDGEEITENQRSHNLVTWICARWAAITQWCRQLPAQPYFRSYCLVACAALYYFSEIILLTVRYQYGQTPTKHSHRVTILAVMIVQLVIDIFMVACLAIFYFTSSVLIGNSIHLLLSMKWRSFTGVLCIINYVAILTVNLFDLLQYEDSVWLAWLQLLLNLFGYFFQIALNMIQPVSCLGASDAASVRVSLPSPFLICQSVVFFFHLCFMLTIFTINMHQYFFTSETILFYNLIAENFLVIQILLLASDKLNRLRKMKITSDIIRLFQFSRAHLLDAVTKYVQGASVNRDLGEVRDFNRKYSIGEYDTFMDDQIQVKLTYLS